MYTQLIRQEVSVVWKPQPDLSWLAQFKMEVPGFHSFFVSSAGHKRDSEFSVAELLARKALQAGAFAHFVLRFPEDVDEQFEKARGEAPALELLLGLNGFTKRLEARLRAPKRRFLDLTARDVHNFSLQFLWPRTGIPLADRGTASLHKDGTDGVLLAESEMVAPVLALRVGYTFIPSMVMDAWEADVAPR